VVVGTSLFQIIFVTAYTTIVQATTNYSVDIVLAFILMVAGVIGAQYGVRVGQRLRGEQLRALLALLVLAVGARLAVDLVVTPRDLYSVVSEGVYR
ncbi:MAG: TSUP family transporter, partial [Shinella sp.]